MTLSVAQSAGVDISKDTLDVHRHPAGQRRRFSNDARGYAALITWLRDVTITRIAFEPTGAYHHAFERRLAAAGLPLVKVNPRQARRFAEAIGRHAKLAFGPATGRTRGTDAVDAALLARFAALHEPPVRTVVSVALDTMKELHIARRALVAPPDRPADRCDRCRAARRARSRSRPQSPLRHPAKHSRRGRGHCAGDPDRDARARRDRA